MCTPRTPCTPRREELSCHSRPPRLSSWRSLLSGHVGRYRIEKQRKLTLGQARRGSLPWNLLDRLPIPTVFGRRKPGFGNTDDIPALYVLFSPSVGGEQVCRSGFCSFAGMPCPGGWRHVPASLLRKQRFPCAPPSRFGCSGETMQIFAPSGNVGWK